MFDAKVYDKSFNTSIKAIAASEKITRAELMALSRSILEAVATTEDIGYVNKLLEVLTPVNRKVAVLYFKEFTGFKQADGVFTKKNKPDYDETSIKRDVFLDDPLNNIWTWAERAVEIEPKAFDLSKVTTYIASTLKKAEKAGLSQADVLQAILAGGMSMDVLLETMDKMD